MMDAEVGNSGHYLMGSRNTVRYKKPG